MSVEWSLRATLWEIMVMEGTPTCGRGLGRPCHYLTVHSFNYVAFFSVKVMIELAAMLGFERGQETFHPIFRRKSHTVMIFLSPSSLFNFYVDYNYSLLILCVKRRTPIDLVIHLL